MKKWILLVALLIVIAPTMAGAQNAPLPMQQSAALEGNHVFTGTKLSTIAVTWHTMAARWLMIFDAASVPSNGTVAPYYCAYVQGASTQADGSQAFDFTFHPIVVRTGIAVVLSTSATGCGSLTADGSNDWFFGQATQ